MLPPNIDQRSIGRDPETSIRATDTDASQARLSAVYKQYLRDPFIASLVPRPHLVPARSPLINIGTYLRSEAIDELVLKWLEAASLAGTKAQIVSLGAGSDTRFWRIATGSLSQGGRLHDRLACYLELDFSENTTRKVAAIRQKKELNAVVGDFTAADSSLTASIYAIRDVDLRHFQTYFPEFIFSRAPGKADPSNTNKRLLDTSLPTLVIAECVLVYMGQSHSDALIKWFADTFSVAGAIVYEMFGLNDGFGRVMRANLKARDVTLPGVDAYPTLDAQSLRFTNHGFTSARALSLRTIRSHYVSPSELERIAKLEFLDEIEELELVLNHYVISWAVKPSDDSDAGRAELGTWALTQKVGLDASGDG